ncbi:ISAs1 family transposase [Schlesneria sp. T3-172]|uniref:ISAs1 family transposase n=1 Tax=Schlesneria sphaerica TaxID=3373610 RepID=UPI0037CACC45
MAKKDSGGVRLSLEEIIPYFAELEDPRSSINQKHPLVSVIVISIMAVLGGCSGPTGIAEWAELKKDFLLGLLDLPQGIPRKDVFRRVLMSLNPGAFQACFTQWLEALRAAAAEVLDHDQLLLAIDGKTLRRSHDRKKGLGALHSVSIWASEMGLSLGQVATDEKSNEITAIPEVLKLVDLRGAIITIDAMGTQTAIAKQIIEAKADYVLALKGNQGSLYQAATDYLEEQMQTDFADVDARRHTTTETGHGRTETRTYVQLPIPDVLAGADRWASLKTLGAVISMVDRGGKETVDIRYFISSLPLGVKCFAKAVRSHWSIENSCHWTLDVTYREDESRIREKQLRENMAWLNRHTLSLLKQQQNKKSVAMNRRRCGWDDNVMLKTLMGIKS